MPPLQSTMMDLGTPAPHFALPDAVSGSMVRLADFAEAPVFVVMVLCNHCPFVRHLETCIAERATAWSNDGAAVVAICPNDAEQYPDDAPGPMNERAAELGYTFPYLHDDDGAVARAYGAACTPDFFVFDGERRLAYRGRFDASRPGSDEPVTGDDLDAAVRALLRGARPTEAQLPSIGCSIKWKSNG